MPRNAAQREMFLKRHVEEEQSSVWALYQRAEGRKGFFKEVVFMLKPKELKSSKRRELHYSCLENPWTEEPGRLQSIGSQELDTT